MKGFGFFAAAIFWASLVLSGGAFANGRNSTSPEMVGVKGRKFTVGVTEVTQKLYKHVTGTNPSYFKGDNLPVTNVSWYDAIIFCNSLSKREGLTPCYSLNGTTDISKWGERPENSIWSEWSSVSCNFEANGYRLPTKEEWLYAARGGENHKYSGNEYVGGVAWYNVNSERMPHEVGEKFENGYGIKDMSGNVWEWCWDHYDVYSTDMGGSYSDGSKFCILDGRSGSIPMVTKTASLGFRVFRSR